MKPTSTDIAKTIDHEGKSVTIRGWVATVRDMGKIMFVDVRDHTGVIQVVCDGGGEKWAKLGNEYVVEITGEVRARGERFINDKLVTGKIELGASEITVINSSVDLPFELTKDTSGINEEVRLKYRYLDLRTERMAGNLRLRHKVMQFIRNFMDDRDFTEVETPTLIKGTPEGAREFVVPSRLHAGKFYVLPQSPQQFKQLLMVAGLGKYYQIARCYRDEDQRGDRQPEFTQLDVEMSFVQQEDILQIMEELMIALVKEVSPDKHFTQLPFPRLTYAEAMEKYGSDKPDLRKDKEDPKELAFAWVVDFPMFEKDEESGDIVPVHHPFTSPKVEDIAKMETNPLEVKADCFDLIANGFELSSGSIRIHDAELQRKIFERLGLSTEVIQAKFGHMLEAFTYGVPPHGGMAPGLDRIIMLLAEEPNIREVMAFPKTGDARDPLMGAPSAIEDIRLKDAHIKLDVVAKKTK
jgi:aspartyl-tRNA synthetase